MFPTEGGLGRHRRDLPAHPRQHPRPAQPRGIQHRRRPFRQSAFPRLLRQQRFRECRAVTTVSERLAKRSGPFTSRPVLVAPEPSEGERGAPQAFVTRKPPGAARLARAAHRPVERSVARAPAVVRLSANLPPLLELIPALEDARTPPSADADLRHQPGGRNRRADERGAHARVERAAGAIHPVEPARDAAASSRRTTWSSSRAPSATR